MFRLSKIRGLAEMEGIQQLQYYGSIHNFDFVCNIRPIFSQPFLERQCNRLQGIGNLQDLLKYLHISLEMYFSFHKCI